MKYAVHREKPEKLLIILASYAVIDVLAMMIKLLCASLALATMMRAN